jgi:TRAP-type mannitol/chloroaromatic compound transport system substrate-binding protein
VGLPRIDRRGLLKYASVSGLASLATACLSQNAPTTAVATGSPGIGAPATQAAPQQQTITWKVQTGWTQADIFQDMVTDWANMINDMSGGKLKIDILPVNTVTNTAGAVDAVSSGTLDGAHHVPVYYYGKDHTLSMFGTGPMMGMSGNDWLSWYYFGGGQDLYHDIVQRKLKLNIVSFFNMPMINQPLGWFKDEIKSPDDFKGMKFRTVGLATGIYGGMGASVISVPGAEVASALDRGTIDAAEFNNTTSDLGYGLADARKVMMVQSYHQPTEMLLIDINKTKYEALSKDLQAIVKWATIASSAWGNWKQIAKNPDDMTKIQQKGVKIIKTPQSVLDAQLKTWDSIIATESKDNPEFVKVLESQKKWAQKVFPWKSLFEIPTPDPVSYKAFFK